MATLGAEWLANGEKSIARETDDCISNDARLQIASLGISKLETTPIVTSEFNCATAPICSIQPPTNASPCRPSTITPFVNVENRVPNKNVAVSTNKHSNK